MANDPDELKKQSRAKLAAILRNASEELLAEGARIAVDALKELRELQDAELSLKPGAG